MNLCNAHKHSHSSIHTPSIPLAHTCSPPPSLNIYRSKLNTYRSKHSTVSVTINEMESRLVDDTKQFVHKVCICRVTRLDHDGHGSCNGVSIYIYIYICIHIHFCIYIYTYIYTYIYKYTHVHIYICIYVCICIYIYICICIIYILIYTCIFMYI